MNEREKQLRGEVTEWWPCAWDKDLMFPIYGNSKIYYISSPGSPDNRAKVINGLKSMNVEILKPSAMFKYIEIALEDDKLKEKVVHYVEALGLHLMADSAM